MRGLTIYFAALAVAAVPVLATWSAPLPTAMEGKACRCQANGYPKCDCGQGDACRCVTLRAHPLPLAARVVLGAATRKVSGGLPFRAGGRVSALGVWADRR